MDRLIKLLLVVTACSLQADVSSCVTPVILEGPKTQVVPYTQGEAQFTCHVRASAAFWLIDGESLFDSQPDCVRTEYNDVHDFANVEVTRRIGLNTQGCNGTKVECVASGENDDIDLSSPAFLYLVYPPSPPDTVLTTINVTALQFSWTKPYSWDGFPVLSYTLSVRNMTSSSLIDALSFTNNTFEYVLTVDSVLSECHTISVEVTANNSVGESSPGMVTGGFPIAVSDFLLAPSVEVTFTPELTPIVNVTFVPPLVCWFQEASYTLKVFDDLTETQVPPNKQGTYGGSDIPTISESYELGIEKDREYEAVVEVESLTGTVNATVQFNTSINISPQDIPQLAILNFTAILVQWNRSSTFQSDVGISYTLIIRNETDQFVLEEEIFNVSANFVSYPIGFVYKTDSFDNSGCHNISFTIFSHSSTGGNERPGSAVTGFPVGPMDFSASLSTEVTFTTMLEPMLDVIFEYPALCWYQDGTYNIQILNADGSEVMAMGPVQYRSTDNPHITEAFKTGLSNDEMYKVVVTAESFGESAQAEKEFSTAIITRPTSSITQPTVISEPNKGGESIDLGMIIGIAAGAGVLVVIVGAVFIACVIAQIRRRKRKLERQRRPPLPQIPNPLYETGGPIYEEIPGEKSFNTLTKTQPSTLPPSEYVMIEGKMNGDIDHYDQLCVSEKDFDDLKKDLSSTKSLGASGGETRSFTGGEDAYTLMNPAGAACASKDSSDNCHSLPRNAAAGGLHASLAPSLSLPLVSMRVARQESEGGDTPEERYVRRSLLI